MVETQDAGSTIAPALAPAELLIEVNGMESIQRLEGDTYRIGRAESNELSYPGVTGLSREHLAIEREGNDWVARDLGSTNGSLVNGERISQPRILHSGDRINAGPVSMVYRESAADAVTFTDDASATAGTTTMSESLQG